MLRERLMTPSMTSLDDLPDIECRRHERLPHEVEICLWYRKDGRLVCVKAWSQDVSEGGLRFRCREELPEKTVYVSATPEAVPSEFGEIRIARAQPLGDGWWDYGAEVQDVL
jgi:hypothetical protein